MPLLPALLFPEPTSADAGGEAEDLDAMRVSTGVYKRRGRSVVEMRATALFMAASRGDVAEVRSFLQRGADENTGRDDGRTPFMAAALDFGWPEAEEMLRLFLPDALVDRQDEDGFTVLMLACKTESLALVQFLVEEAEVDKNVQSIKDGSTALHTAVAANRVEIVRYLLEAGANRTLVNREGKTPRQLAEERGFAEVAALFE